MTYCYFVAGGEQREVIICLLSDPMRAIVRKHGSRLVTFRARTVPEIVFHPLLLWFCGSPLPSIVVAVTVTSDALKLSYLKSAGKCFSKD